LRACLPHPPRPVNAVFAMASTQVVALVIASVQRQRSDLLGLDRARLRHANCRHPPNLLLTAAVDPSRWLLG